jgi:uncharacterized membrane protein
MVGGKILSHLASGDFLTRERIRLWSLAIGAASLIALAYLGLTAHGLNDYNGRPLGTDFSNVYAAGTLAREGHAAAPFDPALQHAREQAIFGKTTPFYGWHYPPFFLFVAQALASLPYIPALIVWQVTSFALYVFALARLTKESPAPQLRGDPLWLLLAAAFPAVFINLVHGHNGFLTAALFAGALSMLPSRPAVAGILFGLSVYKPQFGVLIPFALIAGGYWRAVFAATATVIGFALAVTAAYGMDVWTAFLASTEFTRHVVLEQGGAGWFKIQSMFSLVRMYGGPIELAYAAQGAIALVVVAAVVHAWSRTDRFAAKGALLCIGSFLATPYSLDYDMMILAPAILLLAADHRSGNMAPWRATAIALLWLVPFFARALGAIGLPVGAIAILAVFVLVARQERAGESASGPAPTFA